MPINQDQDYGMNDEPLQGGISLEVSSISTQNTSTESIVTLDDGDLPPPLSEDSFPQVTHLKRAKELGQAVETRIQDANKFENLYETTGIKPLYEQLYPHFLLDNLNWNSFKPVFRTWAQVWISTLFIIIFRTSEWIGPSAYLVSVGGAISASGSQSISNCVLTSICNMFMVAGPVLFIVVSNAISWAIMGCPSKPEIFDLIYSRGSCQRGDEFCATKVVLSGEFLSSRTGTIYAVQFVLGMTFFGYLPVFWPRLFTLPWIFYCVVYPDLTNTYVKIPYLAPWQFSRSVVVSAGISSIACVASSLLLWPTTSNKKCISQLAKVTEQTHAAVSLQNEVERTLKPSDIDFSDKVAASSSITATLKKHCPNSLDKTLSKFEVAYSRFNSGDIESIQTLLSRISIILHGFQFFYSDIQSQKDATIASNLSRIQRYHTYLESNESPYGFNNKYAKKPKHTGTFERSKRRNHDTKAPESFTTRGTFSLGLLDKSFTHSTARFAEISTAAEKTLGKITEWLYDADKFRASALWPAYRRKRIRESRRLHNELSSSLQDLASAYKELDSGKEFIEALLANVPEKDRNKSTFLISQLAHSAFLSKQLAYRVENLARFCLHIDKIQPGPCIVHPWSKPHLQPEFFDYRDVDANAVFGNTEDEHKKNYVPFVPGPRSHSRDPDSTPPLHFRHLFGLRFRAFYRLCMLNEVHFSIKRALVCFCLMLPGFFKSKAEWFGNVSGPWAAVLCGLTLSRTAADGAYGFICRLVFTFIGCFVAVVGWYASGSGNPYGFAAVFAVIFLVYSWHRQHSSHTSAIPTVILGLTLAVVLATSYRLKYWPQPGTGLVPGFELGLARFVTVAVGLTTSFIFTLLPRPLTAKSVIRELLSNTLSDISDLQAILVNFSMKRFDNSAIHGGMGMDVTEEKILKMSGALNFAIALKNGMRFEPPLTGLWPRSQYQVLIDILKETVHLYWLLYLALDTIEDTKQMPRYLYRMSWSNSDVTASLYSVIYMASRALVTSEPLPAVTCAYLQVLHKRDIYKLTSFGTPSEYRTHLKEQYLFRDGKTTLVTMVLVNLIYERLDGVMLLVKALVGENFETDIRPFEFATEIEKADEENFLSTFRPDV